MGVVDFFVRLLHFAFLLVSCVGDCQGLGNVCVRVSVCGVAWMEASEGVLVVVRGCMRVSCPCACFGCVLFGVCLLLVGICSDSWVFVDMLCC